MAMQRLTPATTAELLDRFHGFDDAVLAEVRLTFGYGPASTERHGTLIFQAMDQSRDGEWSDVTFDLAGVATYRLTENPRNFHRVLSLGLAILWNDDGTVTFDVENLDRGEESAWFIRAASCEWDERESA